MQAHMTVCNDPYCDCPVLRAEREAKMAETRSSRPARQRPVKDGGPKPPSEAEASAMLERQDARARAALEAQATLQRREVALTAAALIYRRRTRHAGRVLLLAREFESYLERG